MLHHGVMLLCFKDIFGRCIVERGDHGLMRTRGADNIPELKSSLSTRATLSPLLAASTATPAPVAPPPTMSKSNSSVYSAPVFFDDALSESSICVLEGGVHGGGGLLVSFVEGGYVGPEFR